MASGLQHLDGLPTEVPLLRCQIVLAALLMPADQVVSGIEVERIGRDQDVQGAAVVGAFKLNPTRASVKTTALPGWSGSVSAAVCGPQVDCVQNASDTHQLSVPAGARALRIVTDWGNPAYDLDLQDYNPAGQLVGSSAQGDQCQ